MEGLAATHEILPRPGTAYSIAGINTGLQATLTCSTHYPVEAHCAGCGEIILTMHLYDDWHHTGRKPGDPR